MAKLFIERPSGWNNSLRDINIYLDGKKIGSLTSGQSKEFEVEEGNHQLSAKLDWARSKPHAINLDGTSEKSLKLISKDGNTMRNILVLSSFILLFILLKYSIGFEIHPGYILAMIAPLILHRAYLLTLGRKGYFVFSDVSKEK